MNFRLSILFCLLFSGALFGGQPGVSIQVHPESENKTTDHKAVAEARARWLVVRVTNPSNVKLEGLTLKWKLYAASLKRGANDTVVEKAGEMSFSVDPNGRSTDLTTPKVPFTWSPQHSVRSGSGRSAVYKKVEETGHRYHGYVVQVLNGDTVLGEAVSSEALKHLED